MLAIALGTAGGENAWRWKVALYLIPVAIYGVMMLGQKFPVQERVAAGVSYTDMLREFGWAGCLIVSIFMAYAVDEILRVFGWHLGTAADGDHRACADGVVSRGASAASAGRCSSSCCS